ncbi:hypothetical protein BDF20DRAFT_914678 [Mycotypha africana]|uniref:uncharacterized protein n=1 Tax=Mycotypha africana TaxID=64632 RepID=UPI002301B51A|nr:uncharacterized protein BDF20DRAFT_914678 [Mycotypha africana]KAI8973195.1 hypothetical protein BDF20DRAFT_914678 [Mycotypha africana]
MAKSAASVEKKAWFDLKYWVYIIPIAYIISFLIRFIPYTGFFNIAQDFNIDNCVKFEGPSDFMNCEDFVLSNEAGIAIVACDPARSKFNKVLKVNKLLPGELMTQGSIWKVNYAQEPGSIDKFSIKENNSITADFHPLGLALDIHPTTGKKTLLVVNLPHHSTSTVEVFSVDSSNELTHKQTIRHSKIYSPNSIHIIKNAQYRAADGTPSFFFTNDHYFSHTLLKYLESFFFPLSNVGFYNARTREVEKGVNGLMFGNGLAGTDEILFVAETSKRLVKQYKIGQSVDGQNVPHMFLDYATEKSFPMAVDNLHYVPSEKRLLVAGHPKPLQLLRHAVKTADQDVDVKPPSQVYEWNIRNGESKILIQDDGSLYGTSTSSAIDVENSKLIVSGLYEQGLLICEI